MNFRLLYAFFLMEKMKYKQQSLQELNEIEELHPAFHIQLVLSRYKSNLKKILFSCYLFISDF